MRTLVEIEAEMQKLNEERDALKTRLRVLQKERDEAHYSEEFRKLPEAQKIALKKMVIAAQGTASGEAFGNLGGEGE